MRLKKNKYLILWHQAGKLSTISQLFLNAMEGQSNVCHHDSAAGLKWHDAMTDRVMILGLLWRFYFPLPI